jgi:hypothetical protein
MPKLLTDANKSRRYNTGTHFVGPVLKEDKNGNLEPTPIACMSCMCPIPVGEDCHAWLATYGKDATVRCAECCASELEEGLNVLE